MQKEWILKEIKDKKVKTVLAKLLAIRGLSKKAEIQAFLNPLEMELTKPNVFCDMEKATARIVTAIDGGENILVYGDFDADGVTSTALLLKTLEHLDAKVSHFIPDRELHGHGLNSKALVKLMTTSRPKVVITCDCATSDVEQVAFLNSFKIDTIITDHHEAPEIMPKALAIINPKAPNALDESLSAKQIEDLTSLAGVGVAFKLAQSLLEHYEKLDFINKILPYVAVGTVADLVPLVGENRYFVTKGLQIISSGKHLGLKRLLEVAGYDLEQGITSENIAFGVAPRINASGRLDTVEDALKVLTSDKSQEIELAIISLNNFNKVRQELGEQIFQEACAMLDSQPPANSIILFNPKWHIGIIGIVASKLVEKFHKPTFLMTYSEETKQIRCSARSIEGVNLYDVISINSENLDGFGGHAMAAGLSFSVEKTTFEAVRDALEASIKEILEVKPILPNIKIDLEIEPEQLNEGLISDISRLEPFGMGNPNPIFALSNATLRQKKLMGSNKSHLKLVIEDSANDTYDCVWWSKGDISLVAGDKLDIAFCPQLNTFNGITTIQLMLKDIHADNLVEEVKEEVKPVEIKIFDQRKKTNIFHLVDDYVKGSKLGIKIFAEEKRILQNLEKHPNLFKNVFNRKNVEACDVVMFFDYPPTQDLLEAIIKISGAKAVHFMNYMPAKLDEKELLKTFSAMIKFTCNNKDGMFNLLNCAGFLGLTKEVVESLLEVFEQAGMIEIKNAGEVDYKIEFTNAIELPKALHTIAYKDFLEQYKLIEGFRLTLIKDELSF